MNKKIKRFLSMALAAVIGLSPAIGTMPVYAATPVGNSEYALDVADLTYNLGGDVISITGIKNVSNYTNIELPATFDVTVGEGNQAVTNTYKASYTGSALRDLGGKNVDVAAGATIASTETDTQIKSLIFENGVVFQPTTGAFKDWNSLESVTNLGYAIKSLNADVQLDNMFEGCSSLKNITIDGTGNTHSIAIVDTFVGCSKLESINFTNCNITSVKGLSDESLPDNAKVTFTKCKFPAVTNNYMSTAFTKTAVDVTFSGCTSANKQEITLYNAFSDTDRENGDIKVTSDVKFTSLETAFKDSHFNKITVSGNVKPETVITGAFNGTVIEDTIVGLDTWQIGQTDLSNLFKDTLIVKGEEEALKIFTEFKDGKNFSQVIAANCAFDVHEDTMSYFDYSGMDLSGIDSLTISASTPKKFKTPTVSPARYNLKSNVYYQTDASREKMNGYALAVSNPVGSAMMGDDLPTSTMCYTEYATIGIHNVGTGESNTYFVIPGEKLSKYVPADHDFYTTEGLKTKANLDVMMNPGTTRELYYDKTNVDDSDIEEGISYSFGTDANAIGAKVADSNKKYSLVSEDAVLNIHVNEEQAPANYVQDPNMKDYAHVKFYDIGMSITDNAGDHVVTEIDSTLSITVPLPDDYVSGPITVYNYHNGLDAQPNTVSSSINTQNKTLTIVTSEYSMYALVYGTLGNNTVHVVLNWNDNGHEQLRPANEVFNYTAEYSDGTKKTGSFSMPRNTAVDTQNYDLEVPSGYVGATLSKLFVEPQAIANYAITSVTNPDTPDTITFTATYTDSPSTITIKWANDTPADRPVKVRIYWGSQAHDKVIAEGTYADVVVETTGNSQTYVVPSPMSGTNNRKVDGEAVEGYTVSYDDANLTLTYTKNGSTPVNPPTDPDVENYAKYNYQIEFDDAVNLPESVTATVKIAWSDGVTKTYNDIIPINDTLTVYSMQHPRTRNNLKPSTVVVSFSDVVGYTTPTKYNAGIPTVDNFNIEKKYESNGIEVQKTPIRVKFVDLGNTDFRPDSVTGNATATYSDGSTKNKSITLDTSDKTKDEYASEVAFENKNGSATLTSVTVAPQAINNYTLAKDDANHIYTYTFQQGATSGTTYFGVEFEGAATVSFYPTKVELPVSLRYQDGTSVDDIVTITVVGDSGVGEYTYDLENSNGSKFKTLTYSWPELDGFERVGTGTTAVYRFTGGSSTPVNTDYTLTVKFVGDTDAVRPKTVNIPWTANYTDGTKSTGTTTVNVTGTTTTAVQSIPSKNGASTLNFVDWNPSAVSGYTITRNGLSFTYTYTSGEQSDLSYTVKFDDENNKAGKRPESLTITLKDSTDASKTVSATLRIENPTTTTTTDYQGTVKIPQGAKYEMKEVTSLPSGYKAEYSGTTATLKYTPETIEKTYKVEFKNDVESVRPSSVSIKVKSGDTEAATLSVSKDTNWSATTKLSKYLKGVEAAYTPSAEVSNYSTSVNGETITLTYTGTLTEEQKKEAEDKSKTDEEKEKEKEDLYNFDKFDWIDYANKYPDVKKAFGYNKEALYAHYIHYGIAEGRIATFTGKYENVNEDILKAYFPNDYKYKTDVDKTGIDEMLEGNGSGSNSSSNTTITQNEDGTTTIRTKNADGTITEKILDADGNVLSTRTYATGDIRTDSLMWIILAIFLVAGGLVGVLGFDMRKDKKRDMALMNMIDML